MRIILDTGVFFRPDALESFRAIEIDVVVPSVVLAERRRQLANAARDPREIDRILARGEFDTEPFGTGEACNMMILDDDAWERRARDAMIAAHVRDGDVLWTTNPKDFLTLGLRPEQVHAVYGRR